MEDKNMVCGKMIIILCITLCICGCEKQKTEIEKGKIPSSSNQHLRVKSRCTRYTCRYIYPY